MARTASWPFSVPSLSRGGWLFWMADPRLRSPRRVSHHVFFGERQNPASKLAAKVGDCSYGLYLYAWPAEQILRQFTGTTSPFWLFLGALPLAGTLAFLSCHLIEKPAMKRRGAVAALTRSAFNKLFKGVRAPAVVGAKIVFVVGALPPAHTRSLLVDPPGTYGQTARPHDGGFSHCRHDASSGSEGRAVAAPQSLAEASYELCGSAMPKALNIPAQRGGECSVGGREVAELARLPWSRARNPEKGLKGV